MSFKVAGELEGWRTGYRDRYEAHRGFGQRGGVLTVPDMQLGRNRPAGLPLSVEQARRWRATAEASGAGGRTAPLWVSAAALLLVREGAAVNREKLYRLYKEEKLTVRKSGGRKRALGTRAPMTIPQGANQHWSVDFASVAF